MDYNSDKYNNTKSDNLLLFYFITLFQWNKFTFSKKKTVVIIMSCFQGCHMVRKSQEKLKKKDKSQDKMGDFEKKSGNLIKFKNKSDFVSLNLQNSLFSKAFKW